MFISLTLNALSYFFGSVHLLKTVYIWLHGFINEPTTTFTDLLLAFFCFWSFKTISSYKNRTESVERWSLFFLLVGVSTFFGSIAHTISWDVNAMSYKMVWAVMQMASGMSVFYAQRSVISAEITDQKIKQNLEKFTSIQFIVFACCVIIFLDFKVVAINSAVGLIQLLILTFPRQFNSWNYNGMVTSGFLISFSSIYVNRTKFSFTHWFNYNDIAHVIMLVSLYFIFCGVRDKHHFKEANPSIQSQTTDTALPEMAEHVFEELN